MSVWLCVAPGGAVEQVSAAPRLVTAAWLAEHLNDSDLALLHVGSVRDDAAHMPGARLVSLADFAVSDSSETALNLQMLPADQLKARLEGLGISDSSRIVICSATNAVQSATRVMLTLDYAGLGGRASLLDDGRTGWVRDGRPTSDVAPAGMHQAARMPHVLSDRPLAVHSRRVSTGSTRPARRAGT